jgi:hypothetical protein
MTNRYPYRVISCSSDRAVHEDKKLWLEGQGYGFRSYDIVTLPYEMATEIGPEYWRGLNFYWCFPNEEIATMFSLKWESNNA